MQYISPYKLFNCSSLELLQRKISQLGEIDVKYASIQDHEIVHVFASKLTKGDLRRLLTEMSDSQHQECHTFIFENKSLLNFLEYGHINLFRNNINVSSYSQELLAFIHPYFVFQFEEAMDYALKTRDSQTVELLSAFDFTVFSTSDHQEEPTDTDQNEQLDDYVRIHSHNKRE